MIGVNNLFKKYYIGKEKLTVLNNVSLEIEQGEFVVILGASGCGKSTLLNIIGGLDNNIEGNLCINDVCTKQYKEKDWNHWRKQNVGFIFQSFNLIPHLTAKENVKLAMKFNGSTKEEAEKRAQELIAMVGLLERSDHLPSQLSGGQKQRVAIARAMANNPRIILADEPTGALDTGSAKKIMNILHSLHRNKGVTIIMVTHNKKLAEEADRIIYMKDGQIENIASNDTFFVDKQKSYKDKPGRLSKLSAIEIGIKNIILQKKRSILTILGTAIGITGMVLMMGIGRGAENKINNELGGFLGDNTIWVKGADDVKVFDENDIEVLEGIEGVDRVFDNNRFYTVFNYQDISMEGTVDTLLPIENRQEHEYQLAHYGSLPREDDSKEIVLTSDIAKGLLKGAESLQALIGKDINLLSTLDRKSILTYEVEEAFTVVGIIDSGIISGPSYIPYDTASSMAATSAGTELAMQEGVEVITSPDAAYKKVVEDIRGLGYAVTTNKEDFETISTMVMALRALLIFIAAVALFVSGIMIKIVLQTNVIERTKEIGIMCAIGAGRKDVKRIFVAEAGVLGALAGVAGVILGELLGRLLNNILVRGNGLGFSVYDMSIKNIVICVLISIVIAVMSGRKPAKKAARINPTIALRYE